MTPAAVLFDCDGVLVDSEDIAFDLLMDEFANHGLTLPRARMEVEVLGLTMVGVADRARALGAALPQDWVARFYERLYARLEQGTPLIPGILEVLERLDAAGIPYAVGSNGSDRKMEITLGQHPALWARLQGRMFSGQTLGTPKPAPGLWLHAARALGVDPAGCSVVEDSPTGARAARAAGMRCFAYAPHGDGARMVAEGALPFRAMAELPGLLGI
ncbi:HAD family hydrolase [Neotabrizicola shimadae]|uniref:phosphoglycolate phosphatase n=1 Tax=Neotabrizicola shimadae TaxID=2807096 RepID=A0A8G0ZTN3_9RHOB|nr:HAD-IA family hydrolase [Neotabrizicola shimadae]QYZ69245.1 HAD-IA family hydrolase [Neotabrizicola shimadae]